MAKKIKLKIDPDNEEFVIGIACQKNDYWIAYQLNSALKLNLRRIPDLPVIIGKSDKISRYQLFYYENPESMISYFLISNRGTSGKLIPSLKNIDFFLLLNGNVVEKDLTTSEIKRIKHVLFANSIDLQGLKESVNLMSNLELHLLEINKNDED
ncbi:MAG: IPExxxVDY family protein [Bacteroidales bacterium]|nr:IPExxxVDY family protein [Bacteroidales bacterium]